MAFSISLISVNIVVSSNSSNIVTLSVVGCISSSVSVFIKTVVCIVDDCFGVVVVTDNFSVAAVFVVVGVFVTVVVVCGFFVAGFVAVVSIGLGFVMIGLLVTGTLFVDDIIGFRVGKRVVSVNKSDDVTTGLNEELGVVCDVLGDGVTLGIKIHPGFSVFTEKKNRQTFFLFFIFYTVQVNAKHSIIETSTEQMNLKHFKKIKIVSLLLLGWHLNACN